MKKTENRAIKRAVLVFSGGQDSTTCLIQALHQYDQLHCITFDYGQRHRSEITIAQELAKKLKVASHKILDLQLLNGLAISSLTRENIPVPKKNNQGTLPDTFVPGRNILFLTFAAIYAYQLEADVVITGVCETDFSGYPDCRDEFVKALNHAVNLGIQKNITFVTPLMWLNKAETWALADYYEQMPLIREQTLTCYNGIKGDGCSECLSCQLRSKGLEYYLAHKEEVIKNMKLKSQFV